MVLSVLPLLLATRHQTQISDLGWSPGRQAHTCTDRLAHTHTHTHTHTQVLTASLLTIRLHLSVVTLAKKPWFNPGMIKIDNNALKAVSVTFERSFFSTTSVKVVMNRSIQVCVCVWRRKMSHFLLKAAVSGAESWLETTHNWWKSVKQSHTQLPYLLKPSHNLCRPLTTAISDLGFWMTSSLRRSYTDMCVIVVPLATCIPRICNTLFYLRAAICTAQRLRIKMQTEPSVRIHFCMFS